MSSSASCAKCLFQFTLNSESLDISNNQVYCAQCWTVFRNEQLDQAQLPAQLCWSENLPSKGSLSRTGQGSTSPRRWEHATNAAAVAVDAVAAAPAAEAAAEADKMPAAASVQPAGPGPSAKRRLARKATVAKEAKAAAKAADAKAAEAEDDDNAIVSTAQTNIIVVECVYGVRVALQVKAAKRKGHHGAGGKRRKGNLKFELVVGKKGDGCTVRLKRKSYGKTWQLAVAVKKKKQKRARMVVAARSFAFFAFLRFFAFFFESSSVSVII